MLRIDVSEKTAPHVILHTSIYNESELPIKIGTLPTCALKLTGSGVSRLHAMITKEEDKIIVQALTSTAPTIVNGRPTHRDTIISGNVIVIGNNLLTITESVFDSVDGTNVAHAPPPLSEPTVQAATDAAGAGLADVAAAPTKEATHAKELAEVWKTVEHLQGQLTRAVDIMAFYAWCAQARYLAPKAECVAGIVQIVNSLNESAFMTVDELYLTAMMLHDLRHARQQAKPRDGG